MDLADAAAGRPIGALTLEGSDEQLRPTDVAQPAVFAISLALAEFARSIGVRASALCGHSLGEYTAAVASGALDEASGMRLVAERGRLMAAVQAATPGKMAGVIGLERATIEAICARVGNVVVANVNGPHQVVISGTAGSIDRATEEALSAGAFDVVNLSAGAAFHSPLMASVKPVLANLMADLEWRDPKIPVVTNVDGRVVRNAAATSQRARCANRRARGVDRMCRNTSRPWLWRVLGDWPWSRSLRVGSSNRSITARPRGQFSLCDRRLSRMASNGASTCASPSS